MVRIDRRLVVRLIKAQSHTPQLFSRIAQYCPGDRNLSAPDLALAVEAYNIPANPYIFFWELRPYDTGGLAKNRKAVRAKVNHRFFYGHRAVSRPREPDIKRRLILPGQRHERFTEVGTNPC